MAKVHKITAHRPRDTQIHTMKVSVSHVTAICGILVAAASQSPVLSNGARALYPGLKFDSSNQVKFQDSPSNSVRFEDQSEPPTPQNTGYGSTGPQFEEQDQTPLHYDRSYKPVKFDSTGAGSMHMNLMHEPHHQVHHVQQQVGGWPTVHLVQPVHTVQQVHSVQPVHTVQTVQPVQTVQTVQPVQTVQLTPTHPRPVHPYSYVVDNAPANTLNTPVFAEHHLQDFRKPEHHKHLQKGVSPWRKVVRVLAAAIPIGLFLAALPPNVVHINATQAVKPLGTANMQVLRKSVDSPSEQNFPILNLIENLGGLSALRHPGCEAHVFCEMARLGSTPAANMVQRTLWSMANETPEEIVELLGARELLAAVRKDACNTFECPRPVDSESDPAVLQAVGQDLR